MKTDIFPVLRTDNKAELAQTQPKLHCFKLGYKEKNDPCDSWPRNCSNTRMLF